ncbi:MAG: hypothetical protein EXX96DRAFT_508148 [Benjaminiella poitrasii]|nr:MAG: hypothetical protein EXX96DRAFT_508148 [Benjaminiella poitrasii]
MKHLKQTSFVVFSGGSACNHILSSFHNNNNHNDVSYILGVSDNGGSSSELLRVLGGPSIGDLRSRLIRLMDTVEANNTTEMKAIKSLLNYRLPSSKGQNEARIEWNSIVEGHHSLWNSISIEKKEVIRGFFTLFDHEVAKQAHKRFNFCNGSIGNFLLTGARLFTGSLEAAIFLFASIVGLSFDLTSVIPVISDNQTFNIAALLSNGDTLVGQCEISHPSIQLSSKRNVKLNAMDAFSSYVDKSVTVSSNDNKIMVVQQDTNSNLFFSKHMNEKLHSPIERVFYINQYGQEIYPMPNTKVISRLSTKQTLVYSIGSLYTSLIPSLILRGVGNAIAHSESLKHKVLLLNGTNDRETTDFTAFDFIQAIVSALNQSQETDSCLSYYHSCDEDEDDDYYDVPSSNTSVVSTFTNAVMPPLSYSSSSGHHSDIEMYTSPILAFITHLVYLDNSDVYVDVSAIEKIGIRCVSMKGKKSELGEPIYDQDEFTKALQSIVHNDNI